MQLKERGWDIAGDRASGAINLVRRKRRNGSVAAQGGNNGAHGQEVLVARSVVQRDVRYRGRAGGAGAERDPATPC